MASLTHLWKLGSLQRQLTADNVKLGRLKDIKKVVDDLEAKKKGVNDHVNAVQKLDSGRPLYPVFMSEFVTSVPEGIRVKTLGTKGGGAAGPPLALTISAEARTNEDIAAWIRKLEGTGKFTGVDMGPVTSNSTPDGTVNSFSLKANYAPGS
jgi:Tfp pilus assembly protein PilN